MQRKRRQPGKQYDSVFVDVRKEDGTLEAVKLYTGDSLYSAQMAHARGVTDYPLAWRIELRRDFALWKSIYIE